MFSIPSTLNIKALKGNLMYGKRNLLHEGIDEYNSAIRYQNQVIRNQKQGKFALSLISIYNAI